jgi:hypothetical protein
MATHINFKKENTFKNGYVGFSWTTFFFGFFVPLIRKDWKWFGIMIGISIAAQVIASSTENYALTGITAIAQIVLAFIYNGIHAKELLAQGYEPADEVSRIELIKKGIINS